MKKTISLITFLIIAAIIAFFIYFQKSDSWNVQNELSVDIVASKEVTVAFIFGEQDIFYINHTYRSSSLFEITQAISQEQNWNFDFEDYGDMGILITQIKDKKNGEGQKYWQYFVDNTQAQISADDYLPMNEEYITWKFIESEF